MFLESSILFFCLSLQSSKIEGCTELIQYIYILTMLKIYMTIYILYTLYSNINDQNDKKKFVSWFKFCHLSFSFLKFHQKAFFCIFFEEIPWYRYSFFITFFIIIYSLYVNIVNFAFAWIMKKKILKVFFLWIFLQIISISLQHIFAVNLVLFFLLYTRYNIDDELVQSGTFIQDLNRASSCTDVFIFLVGWWCWPCLFVTCRYDSFIHSAFSFEMVKNFFFFFAMNSMAFDNH